MEDELKLRDVSARVMRAEINGEHVEDLLPPHLAARMRELLDLDEPRTTK